MKLYADTPGRRTWQLVTDLFVVAWLWFWIWLAVKLYHLVGTLAVPGQKLTGAGDDVEQVVAPVGGALARASRSKADHALLEVLRLEGEPSARGIALLADGLDIGLVDDEAGHGSHGGKPTPFARAR